jgi:hypothetical protein
MSTSRSLVNGKLSNALEEGGLGMCLWWMRNSTKCLFQKSVCPCGLQQGTFWIQARGVTIKILTWFMWSDSFKWGEVSYCEVLEDKSAMYVRVTLYWGYLIILWLFNLDISCTVFALTCCIKCGCVCMGFVMCRCFGNTCICIYCVLYGFTVFLFRSYLFCWH